MLFESNDLTLCNNFNAVEGHFSEQCMKLSEQPYVQEYTKKKRGKGRLESEPFSSDADLSTYLTAFDKSLLGLVDRLAVKNSNDLTDAEHLKSIMNVDMNVILKHLENLSGRELIDIKVDALRKNLSGINVRLTNQGRQVAETINSARKMGI